MNWNNFKLTWVPQQFLRHLMFRFTGCCADLAEPLAASVYGGARGSGWNSEVEVTLKSSGFISVQFVELWLISIFPLLFFSMLCWFFQLISPPKSSSSLAFQGPRSSDGSGSGGEPRVVGAEQLRRCRCEISVANRGRLWKCIICCIDSLFQVIWRCKVTWW